MFLAKLDILWASLVSLKVSFLKYVNHLFSFFGREAGGGCQMFFLIDDFSPRDSVSRIFNYLLPLLQYLWFNSAPFVRVVLGPTLTLQLFLSLNYKTISSLTIPTTEFPSEVKCSPSNALNSCKAFCISGLLLSMAIAFMGSVWTCDSAAVNLGSISNFAREGFPSIFFKRSSVIQSNNYYWKKIVYLTICQQI